MRTYKIAATVSSTANNQANVQLVRNGRIRGVRWSVGYDGPADNAAAGLELSLQPVSQMLTNNTQGVVDELRIISNLTTSGGLLGSINRQSLLDMAVGAGEILYLNATVTGTVSAQTTIFIDVEE